MVREAVVLLVCDAMIISCITFAGALAVICFYHISKADKMSEQSKQLQAKLLKTLCAQVSEIMKTSYNHVSPCSFLFLCLSSKPFPLHTS